MKRTLSEVQEVINKNALRGHLHICLDLDYPSHLFERNDIIILQVKDQDIRRSLGANLSDEIILKITYADNIGRHFNLRGEETRWKNKLRISVQYLKDLPRVEGRDIMTYETRELHYTIYKKRKSFKGA